MSAASLFEATARQSLLERLESVRPDSPRQWGKMDVAQMLAHCQVALRVALGEQKLERNLIGWLFGGIAKRQLLKPGNFGKNLPTAPEFKGKGSGDFAREKAELLRLARRFGEGGPAVLTKDPHPFFGTLSAEEWDALQWKHLDHHLRQFGS